MKIRKEDIPINLSLGNYKYRNIKTAEERIKRLIDIIGSIVGIIIMIPLTVAIWIANSLSNDNGPVFYKQERIGKNGTIFKMYKFRSMVVGAEEKLKIYLAENEDARNEYQEYKKLKNDPRITKVGKFIRKTSLDEFPQFINVLKGDMSLVGPRPYLPSEKEEMNEYFKYITSVKPGITGLWQTSGRNKITFNDRLNMDMKYFYNQSLKLDLKLIGKTVEKMVKKEKLRGVKKASKKLLSKNKKKIKNTIDI